MGGVLAPLFGHRKGLCGLARCLGRLGGRVGLAGRLGRAEWRQVQLFAFADRIVSMRKARNNLCQKKLTDAQLRAAKGIINVKPMIEAVAPLTDGASWFSKLSAKDGGKYMKVILAP